MGLDEILRHVESLAWPLVTVVVTVIMIFAVRALFNWRFRDQPEKPLLRSWLLIIIFIIGAIVFITCLPISETLRGQILSLIGIVLSAAIALSATNFLGNAMAGMMLRGVRNFRMGDFLEAQGYFGRVSSRGLLHVEIQCEDRNFVSLPNMLLMKTPFKVIRSEGTLVSAEVSLGYDVDHKIVEKLLIGAAEKTKLDDPFVFVLELGDFSISYRIHGLLEESNHLLSTSSRLRTNVLDALHQARIEIVSPHFMNQRQVAEQVFIPTTSYATAKSMDECEPERTIFDKANLAEDIEDAKLMLAKTEDEIKALEARMKESESESQERLRLQVEGLARKAEFLAMLVEDKLKQLRAGQK